jgi:hypothetical protein
MQRKSDRTELCGSALPLKTNKIPSSFDVETLPVHRYVAYIGPSNCVDIVWCCSLGLKLLQFIRRAVDFGDCHCFILLDCCSTSRIQMLQGYIQNLRKGIITCSTVANLMRTSLEDLLKIVLAKARLTEFFMAFID